MLAATACYRYVPPTIPLAAGSGGKPIVFGVLDSRPTVLSKEISPSRTGTDFSMVGIPEQKHDFGDNVPVASGLGSHFRYLYFNSSGVPYGDIRPVTLEPSADLAHGLAATAPRPGEKAGLLFVINEWFRDGYNECVYPKKLTVHVVGPGGVSLASATASDGRCEYTGEPTLSEKMDQLFSRLLNAPAVSAALKGGASVPGATAPAPAPAPAAAKCTDAQIQKMKSYGVSDADIGRTCGL
ncbi:MAG: hypothetical protein IPJ65_03260 [Archangiaceae bacterium]|nr:hypothetical protein [Archangiaceae bacterium]